MTVECALAKLSYLLGKVFKIIQLLIIIQFFEELIFDRTMIRIKSKFYSSRIFEEK